MDVCPTCGRETPCPTCGEYDPILQGAPKSNRFKLYRRAVQALHQIRQGYQRTSTVLANELSDIIRRTEATEELGLDVDEEPTEPH